MVNDSQVSDHREHAMLIPFHRFLQYWIKNGGRLLVLLLVLSALAGQATHATVLSVAPLPNMEEAAASSLKERATLWILQTQRNLHRQMTNLLHQMRDTPDITTAWALIVMSFLYGIFHAAGPGHGKAVISTYLLTHKESLRRGVGLSVAASLLQGVTAISLVLILVSLLGWLARDTMGQVRNLELASFLLVAVLGVWLLGRGLRGLWRLRHPPQPSSLSQSPLKFVPLSPAPSLATAHQAPGLLRTATAPASRLTPPRPMAGSNTAAHCGCGTPHHVDPSSRGPWLWTILAVGIRPCTGAVLVMTVSLVLGMAYVGILAVLAMSVGTALTVASLAILAVQARAWAQRRFGHTSERWSFLRFASPLASILGGGVIAWIGWTLFHGLLTYAPARHPLGL